MRMLLAVREAGTINEKFRCVIESFAISGALVKEGITDNGSWTVEDYIKLGEENKTRRITYTPLANQFLLLKYPFHVIFFFNSIILILKMKRSFSVTLWNMPIGKPIRLLIKF